MSIENRLAVLEAQVVQIINERDREPESLRALRARMDGNHNAVLGELGSLHADVQDLRTGQARLEAGQTNLRGDVQELRAGQARLEAGQTQLRGNVQELRGNVQELRGNVQELRGDFQELRGDVEELRSGQARLEAGQQAVMDRLAEVLSKLR
ncbi:hypothetical protein [Nocardia testacea]|uniref:hypothetical protein n=1 Tax=Nocardia testacea TaxID=248551 RepID=UPI0002FE5F3E|nr:hypothetical protein [Nocardia testacea]